MDQAAWNQIYSDLESDVGAMRKRGGNPSEIDIAIAIDKARFAMDRGDSDEAIAIIQGLKRQLGGVGNEAATRSSTPLPTLDRLDALEDNLHAATRLGSARLEVVGEDEEPPSRAASQNTKVNKSIKYEDIKDEYIRIWNTCKLRPEKLSAVRREADRVVANREVYEEIAEATEVPWWFIGLIHGMECSFSLNKHLHNGDSLKARTWQVPAGRPKEGSPPFTFVDSAIDALEYDKFAGKTDWPLPMVLFRLERYNGFGYRKKFGFASPYLWSYTNHFSSGKYVKDGVFDPNAISKQCGAAAMLRNLMERGIVSFDEKAPAPGPAIGAAPPIIVSPPVPPTSALAPVIAAAPVAAPAPVPAVPPVVAPEPVAAATPAPAPAPAQAPVVSAPPAPSPVAAPVVQAAPAPVVAPPPAITVAPSPAPVAAPPAASPAPAPVAVTAAATSPAPAPAASASELPSGVSTAVAAALAELAKRAK